MQRGRLLLGVGLVAAAALIVLAVILSASGPAPHRPPPPPPVPPLRLSIVAAQPAPTTEQYGASVNLLFNGSAISPARILSQLRALRATGAVVARSDAFWEASEPRPPVNGVHHYDWSFDDRVAALLAAAGLRWLPVIDYTAPWAQSVPGQDHSPPRSDLDYAAYAAAIAARYGEGGVFWRGHPNLRPEPIQTFEIWNEPDNPEFWVPQPSAAAYAQLYRTAREAIDAVDPSARVIVGGLTNLPRFLPAMLAAQPSLRGHIDGVGIHPYGRPAVTLARVAGGRATLNAVGLGTVPLYATEFGWTTSPPGALDYVPLSRRAADIRFTVAALSTRRCGLAAAVLYTWYSPEQDPADSQQWYGIASPRGGATPDTAAFSQALAQAAHTPRSGPC